MCTHHRQHFSIHIHVQLICVCKLKSTFPILTLIFISKEQMGSRQRICLPHLFWEKWESEGPQTTAKTTNTSCTHAACLHIGKILCFWPLIHPSFLSSYQLHSAISGTHCSTLRHCVAFRRLGDTALFQCT